MRTPMENNIRAARKRVGMTMKQLGQLVGVAESTISQYENGKRQPDNETLLKIAEELNTSVSYLLGETKKIPVLDDRVIEALTDLRDNSDTRALLEVLPNMTEEQVKQMAAFARFLRRGQEDGEG